MQNIRVLMNKFIRIWHVPLPILFSAILVILVTNTATAGALTEIIKAIVKESDKGAKNLGNSLDEGSMGASKQRDEVIRKLEGGGDDGGSLDKDVRRSIDKKRNKCQTDDWAIVTLPRTAVHALPQINSKIIGSLKIGEKFCVRSTNKNWYKTSYVWVMNSNTDLIKK